MGASVHRDVVVEVGTVGGGCVALRLPPRALRRFLIDSFLVEMKIGARGEVWNVGEPLVLILAHGERALLD
ncbi:MAG: hypothetical protein QF752_00340 [Planctomycetota bacterium]|jgi:hypothetical protein|nr:hypothetical protein [Planctomycetota bacterium]